MRCVLSWWRAFPLALLLLAVTGSSAFAKPKVAVLGLEVTGTIDQPSTKVASELTEGLRSRAKGGNGPYLLAPNSDRELIDEKLIRQCDAEAPGCMADIGRDLGADVLIYGKLEKVSSGYRATLHVLDVKKKTHEKEMTVTLPGGTGGDSVRTLAKQAYADLVGGAAPAGGTVIVTSNVPTGSVLIDDEVKDSLSSGSATIVLAEGRYQLAIEADGYRRKEISVLVKSGDTITETLELVAVKPGGTSTFNVWKPLFYTGLIATLALGSYSTYAWASMNSEGEALRATRISGRPGDITQTDCDNAGDIVEASGTSHFQAACDYQSKHTITLIGAVVAGVATVGTGYMAFGRGKSKSKESSTIAITPVLGVDGAGATVRLDW